MEIFGYLKEIFMGYHRDILGDLYWISNGTSQREAQEIFHQDIMELKDLGWISYGISFGEVKEIFVGDVKDMSGY
jgi:hypothetical protein